MMTPTMPAHLSALLKAYGIKAREIAPDWTQTRLFHDLGLYGDDAEMLVEALRDGFGVDIEGFQFNLYFPSEFYEGRVFYLNWICWLMPFFRFMIDDRSQYQPFTLGDVDRAIRKRRLEMIVNK